MRRPILSVLLLAATALLSPPAAAADLRSQLSGWLALNDVRPSTPRLGLRWQPSLSLGHSLGNGWKLDGEISLAASAALAAPGWGAVDAEGAVDPYRFWLRLAGERFEARLGLQKINFGSATLFRPLMWFDRLDPRDPLQLSDGVWGLLLRGYFRGNATAWLWGLYGNDGTKGWETEPTAARTPELGGRLQVPLPAGEAAVTAHFRSVDAGAGQADESRFALDGKWDVGVGLWAEASLARRQGRELPWQRALAVGVDYTFTLGNGLYMLAEQFFAHDAPALAGRGSGGLSLAALLARYPLGLLDSLNAIVYLDWRAGQVYSFAAWQRTTDHWQFHVMAFANPRQPRLAQKAGSGASFAGRGFQLLAVWNL